MEIIKETVMEVWKAALSHILEEGTDFKDRENRMCREVLNLTLTITNPKNRIDAPMEVMNRSEKWVYPSKEEISGIMLQNKTSTIYEYTYGPRIFNFQNQKNQIADFVIPLLKKDPTSRRAVVILYEPVKDSKIENKNIPSLILIYFKIKEHRLYSTCFIRSNDLFVGWPANIFQINTLQEYLAEKLQLDIGELTTFSASAHIFEEHFDDIKEIIKN
jgi:thymidylate synthase